jgi:hypothetical protein
MEVLTLMLDGFKDFEAFSIYFHRSGGFGLEM